MSNDRSKELLPKRSKEISSKKSKEILPKVIKKKFRLSAKEFCSLRDLFQAIDKDKNNKVTLEELKGLLNQLKKVPEKEELAQFFNRIDKNKDGKIDFEEFVRLLVEEECNLNEDPFLLDAFCFFDCNGDGLITKSEFEKVMRVLGENWSSNQIVDLVQLADSDNDGCISYPEFKKLYKYINKTSRKSSS